MDFVISGAAALLAGFVDAIVGGGGQVLLPALFSVFTAAPAQSLLGTNKAIAVWGTGISAAEYAKRVRLSWGSLIPAAITACGASFLGAYLTTVVSSQGLRKSLPFVMLAVLIYTVLNKDMGSSHKPRYSGRNELIAACLVGGLVGFYDGFFGPGTGSFFVFLFVKVLGYDFLSASAHAKILNVGTNLAALALFTFAGHVWWHLAIPLAVLNIIGAILGTRIALKHGKGFVRWVFIIVVSALVIKSFGDAFL